ncbi:MAG: histidine kinase dimerization/phospho-acceptor domain-containing protein [Euryarchaeota archaeon]|nr:histidine kinase dimerization/phospho-acceptor domain-containing protein [Euryarchaeota archaeon]
MGGRERVREDRLRLQLLDELERSNSELKDFAYIVSHDLKAPLRAITSLAQWLAADYGDKLDDDGREQLELLKNITRRMHNSIESILTYSRIGRSKEEMEEVDLNTLI